MTFFIQFIPLKNSFYPFIYLLGFKKIILFTTIVII